MQREDQHSPTCATWSFMASYPKPNECTCLVRVVEKLKLERRGFRLMAARMVDIVACSALMDDFEAGRYERASGEAECSECGLLYREHPQLPKMPTFHITCLGKIVKT